MACIKCYLVCHGDVVVRALGCKLLRADWQQFHFIMRLVAGCFACASVTKQYNLIQVKVRFGLVVAVLVTSSKLRRAQLVLRWVTVHGCTVLVCNQSLMPTQLPTLSRMGNEHRPRGSGSAVRLIR